VRTSILADFLQKHSSEVLNMLTQEWDWEKYYDIRYEEGTQQGMQRGMQQGMQRGMRRGAEQRAYESARRMLARRVPLEQVAEFTQLPLDKLRSLPESKQ
jgi:predicted transposase/invertase (TIGR01784 family)